MPPVTRHNRKASDADILRFNCVGYSLATVGEKLNLHPTSITARLDKLDTRPADTRRAFMEEILQSIPDTAVDRLADLLTADDPLHPRPIKDYVRELIVRDLEQRQAADVIQQEPANEL